MKLFIAGPSLLRDEIARHIDAALGCPVERLTQLDPDLDDWAFPGVA